MLTIPHYLFFHTIYYFKDVQGHFWYPILLLSPFIIFCPHVSKYPIICSHIYCYSNISLTPPCHYVYCDMKWRLEPTGHVTFICTFLFNVVFMTSSVAPSVKSLQYGRIPWARVRKSVEEATTYKPEGMDTLIWGLIVGKQKYPLLWTIHSNICWIVKSIFNKFGWSCLGYIPF